MDSPGSASEGEILETQKANTDSNNSHDAPIDNNNSAFGLDGATDVNDHRYRGRSYSRSIRSHSTRSPSPYRQKENRSPSPYRRPRNNAERSPSPFRHNRNDRGRNDKPPSHKRKASPPWHGSDRPEKRNHSDRSSQNSRRSHHDHGRTGGHHDNGRTGGQHDNGRFGGQHDNGRFGGQHNNGRFGGQHDNDRLGREHENGRMGGQHARSLRNSDHENRNTHSRNERLNVSTSKTMPVLQNGHHSTRPIADQPDHYENNDVEMTEELEQSVPTVESREEKKRRWAAKRAQHATENATLLQQAVLANASDMTTPDLGSPATPIEMSVSPPLDSPGFPDLDSVPPSPGVMVVGKQEVQSAGASPIADGPSAADYDPTQDMLDDRRRAELKAQVPELSASDYDETNPELLSTLPAEKSNHAKTQKKELDMFAFSDEEDENAENDEVQQPSKGTVLDAKLLDNWDDSEGYYKVISNELVSAGRYRMIKNLGRGVFANVAQAEDVTGNVGQLVAVKIIRRNDAMKKASQKEMDFLQRLNDADPQDKRHIIRLLGSFDHKGHLCIVFEHMSKNLRDLLKEETSGHGLSFTALKAYGRQMMSGLKHLQDCEIVHADLKPDNILVSLDKKTVKISDLGTAADKRDNQEPTPYLVSRFYRAPEIILGMDISYGIDMWAIGCTLYELWSGKILFPGRSNNQMVKVMMECLGWPSEKLLRKGQLSGDHFDAGPPLKFVSREADQFGKDILRVFEPHRMTIRSLKTRVHDAARGITEKGPTAAELNDFADLLNATLNWNLEKRIEAKDALMHKFFAKPALAPRATVVKPAFTRRVGLVPRR